MDYLNWISIGEVAQWLYSKYLFQGPPPVTRKKRMQVIKLHATAALTDFEIYQD